MEEEREEKKEMFHVPHDRRNALVMVKSILKNNVVVEEYKALPNKEK